MATSSRTRRTARRFPPVAESAAAARRFVADALDAAGEEILFAADLLTGELVANAILHAGTAVDVEVLVGDVVVRVSVSDGAPERRVLPRRLDRDAETGRGLQLVEAMSDRFGVEIADTSKTVWFELRSGDKDRAASTWDVPPVRSESRVGIHLVGMPVGLSRAALRHRGALIREAQLALASSDAAHLGVGREDLLATAGINDVLDTAFASVYSGLAPEVGAVDCTIGVPAGCGPAAATLAWVMDTLNERARSGLFLTRPALPEVRRFRLWTIGEILRQLDGDPPTPWTSTPDEEEHTPADRIAWDTGRISSTETPSVAADDDNLIVAVNEAAASMLRWEASELAGKRLTAIIPPAHRERHVAGFTNFLLTGESRIIGVPVKVAALRRDGTTVPIVLTVGLEHTVTGRPVFVGELRPAG